MGEIVNFVKDILFLNSAETIPVGLCGFENVEEKPAKKVKSKRKSEMRLSELFDN